MVSMRQKNFSFRKKILDVFLLVFGGLALVAEGGGRYRGNQEPEVSHEEESHLAPGLIKIVHIGPKRFLFFFDMTSLIDSQQGYLDAVSLWSEVNGPQQHICQETSLAKTFGVKPAQIPASIKTLVLDTARCDHLNIPEAFSTEEDFAFTSVQFTWGGGDFKPSTLRLSGSQVESIATQGWHYAPIKTITSESIDRQHPYLALVRLPEDFADLSTKDVMWIDEDTSETLNSFPIALDNRKLIWLLYVDQGFSQAQVNFGINLQEYHRSEDWTFTFENISLKLEPGQGEDSP